MKRNISAAALTRLAALIAILLVMTYVPGLGYIPVGAFSITLMMLPVGVAAVIIGPVGGAVMGTLFGLTSFLQCVGVGIPAVGLKLFFFSVNPFLTFIWCVIPRFLAGWLPGLIFAAMSRSKLPKTVSAVVACGLGSAFNTIFYMFTLWALFGRTDKVIETYGSSNFFKILLAVVVTNTLLELAVNTFIGGAVSRTLLKFLPARRKSKA
ncbi:MAG: ECF transporter S component [Oscillospiraceae bacterium]|jgi:uncharacterized membrane protein|nr:ECF transporter S component [Oscillospiraceae bacterium]